MYATRTTRTVITVLGLLALCGPGCSGGDKGAQKEAANLKALLDAKQKELDCKMAVMAKVCPTGDSKCEADKAAALQACSTPTDTNSNTSTETNTNTSTSTSTTTQ